MNRMRLTCGPVEQIPNPGAPAMVAEKLPEKFRRHGLAESALQFYKLG